MNDFRGASSPSSKEYSCEDLRNPRRFEEIFDIYSKKLFRYLYLHIGSKEEAEDALSSTFVKVWEYVNNPAQRKARILHFSAFLYRIARNLMIDRYRARKPVYSLEVMRESGIDLPEVRRLPADARAEWALAIDKLSKLEEDDREILILRFVEEIAVGDIAEILGITENNASVRIHRALARFKQYFRQ